MIYARRRIVEMIETFVEVADTQAVPDSTPTAELSIHVISTPALSTFAIGAALQSATFSVVIIKAEL